MLESSHAFLFASAKPAVPVRGTVAAVALSAVHGFSKQVQPSIRLLADLGVEGDAHCGPTVQHLYLKRRNAQAPNLQQVHLFAAEMLHELAEAGFLLVPGDFGENITTQGLDLQSLPLGSRLHLGAEAVLELTGLRTPCKQIDAFRPGLLKQVAGKRSGKTVARAGVMSRVLSGGRVAAGDGIAVELPPLPHSPLQLI